jgi:hypothetical protein
MAPDVTVLKVNGTIHTGYNGTVHCTSTDPQASLPADYTFNAAADVGGGEEVKGGILGFLGVRV